MNQSELRIKAWSDGGEEVSLWDRYVHSHRLGTVFHLMSWQRLVHSSFGHEPQHLIVEDCQNGEIVGLLPLFLVRSRIFGRMLISTPQAAYGGILSSNDWAARALLEHAKQCAVHQKVRFLELRNFQSPLADASLASRDLYVTFQQDLFADSEKNMANIPRKTRAEIREGIRNGLEFRADRIGVDEFFRVYSHSVRELGTPVFSKKLFVNGRREFGSSCKIFSVHWKGTLVSAVWTLFYRDQVIPYYGGSFRKYNRLAVNNFMYWMLMKYGCENGYRSFDFGRSKKGTGSFNFKKRWGMAMSELAYQYHLVSQLSLPDTSPLNPRFSWPIRVWRNLPLSVTNAIGPIIARHLT